MSRLTLIALLTLAALLLPTAASAPAQACLNGVRHQISDPTKDLNDADKAMSQGRLTEAWRRASQPIEKSILTEDQLNRLSRRATRIKALAVIRSRDPKAPIPQDNAAIANATERTRVLLNASPDDPNLVAEHAEALARDPATRVEARKTLEDLAARDLLASPFAWRTLAELRTEAAEPGDALLAIQRCKASAADKRVCDLTPTADPSRAYRNNSSAKGAPRGAKSVPRGAKSASPSKS